MGLSAGAGSVTAAEPVVSTSTGLIRATKAPCGLLLSNRIAVLADSAPGRSM